MGLGGGGRVGLRVRVRVRGRVKVGVGDRVRVRGRMPKIQKELGGRKVIEWCCRALKPSPGVGLGLG